MIIVILNVISITFKNLYYCHMEKYELQIIKCKHIFTTFCLFDFKSRYSKLSCMFQVQYHALPIFIMFQIMCLIQAHSKGLTNTVCTFYELTHGDQTTAEGSDTNIQVLFYYL